MEAGQITLEMAGIAPAAWVGFTPRAADVLADRWQRPARTIFVALLLFRAFAPAATAARAPGCYLQNAVTWNCINASDRRT